MLKQRHKVIIAPTPLAVMATISHDVVILQKAALLTSSRQGSLPPLSLHIQQVS
ncbi:hypothetical protein [Desulfogranum marinum]|uniref:hypothetical protein n=1 Tax=Desulfogranum marinum TaxID=453220 RepID=UPI0029C9140D|nr:hypothetical protein [Desulfogranum marinum]